MCPKSEKAVNPAPATDRTAAHETAVRRRRIRVVVTAVPDRPLQRIEQALYVRRFEAAGAAAIQLNASLAIAEFKFMSFSVEDAALEVCARVQNVAEHAEVLLVAGPLGSEPEMFLHTSGWSAHPPDPSMLDEDWTWSQSAAKPWQVL